MKALALFSLGLDSILATKIIKDSGISLEAIHFVSEFFPLTKKREELLSFFTKKLNVSLTIKDISRELIEIVKVPRYGYGKNLNPCIDCKILMFRKAKEFMKRINADFIVTGEVLNERPFTQRKGIFELIEKETQLEKLILRPLSARLLKTTIVEEKKWIDREKLLSFKGKSRKPQIELAKKLEVYFYPQPSGGCLLTDPFYARRLKDLLKYTSDFTLDDIKLLKIGRHFRISNSAKLVIFRNEEEKKILKDFSCDNFIKFFSQKGDFFSLGIGKFRKEDINLSARIVAFYLKSNRIRIFDKREEDISVVPLAKQRLEEYRI